MYTILALPLHRIIALYELTKVLNILYFFMLGNIRLLFLARFHVIFLLRRTASFFASFVIKGWYAKHTQTNILCFNGIFLNYESKDKRFLFELLIDIRKQIQKGIELILSANVWGHM